MTKKVFINFLSSGFELAHQGQTVFGVLNPDIEGERILLKLKLNDTDDCVFQVDKWSVAGYVDVNRVKDLEFQVKNISLYLANRSFKPFFDRMKGRKPKPKQAAFYQKETLF